MIVEITAKLAKIVMKIHSAVSESILNKHSGRQTNISKNSRVNDSIAYLDIGNDFEATDDTSILFV